MTIDLRQYVTREMLQEEVREACATLLERDAGNSTLDRTGIERKTLLRAAKRLRAMQLPELFPEVPPPSFKRPPSGLVHRAMFDQVSQERDAAQRGEVEWASKYNVARDARDAAEKLVEEARSILEAVKLPEQALVGDPVHAVFERRRQWLERAKRGGT